MEEDSQQESNSLKRKFSEIDGDQILDSVSSPMMIDSNGYIFNFFSFYLILGLMGFPLSFFQGFALFLLVQ